MGSVWLSIVLATYYLKLCCALFCMESKQRARNYLGEAEEDISIILKRILENYIVLFYVFLCVVDRAF